jgi:molybdopterin adenylyltransferase
MTSTKSELRVGIVSISDRASGGVYKDEGIPALKEWLSRVVVSPALSFHEKLIPDEQNRISETLKALVDGDGCHLVLTTGGTGPAPRDVTPEVIRAVCTKELPGFGEQMRAASLRAGVPTAILSRQTAAILGQALVVTLPGKPASIRVCLDAVFPAIPYCIDLIGGPRLEGNPAVVQVFRPPMKGPAK